MITHACLVCGERTRNVRSPTAVCALKGHCTACRLSVGVLFSVLSRGFHCRLRCVPPSLPASPFAFCSALRACAPAWVLSEAACLQRLSLTRASALRAHLRAAHVYQSHSHRLTLEVLACQASISSFMLVYWYIIPVNFCVKLLCY